MKKNFIAIPIPKFFLNPDPDPETNMVWNPEDFLTTFGIIWPKVCVKMQQIYKNFCKFVLFHTVFIFLENIVLNWWKRNKEFFFESRSRSRRFQIESRSRKKIAIPIPKSQKENPDPDPDSKLECRSRSRNLKKIPTLLIWSVTFPAALRPNRLCWWRYTTRPNKRPTMKVHSAIVWFWWAKTKSPSTRTPVSCALSRPWSNAFSMVSCCCCCWTTFHICQHKDVIIGFFGSYFSQPYNRSVSTISQSIR